MKVRYQAHRLAANPILHPGLDKAPPARRASTLQSPSLIRVPAWVHRPLGRYYLYFAQHLGTSIRLAFADALGGPWRVHGAGVLDLAASLFPTRPLPAPAGTPTAPDLEEAGTPHLGAPQVLVDHANRRIVMYFAGLAAHGTPRTRVATSSDGLAFTAREPLLGPPGFRVFRHGGAHFAIATPGVLYRSEDGLTDFMPGPALFPPTQRHAGLWQRDDTLHVFWTQVTDAPERILASRIGLAGDWQAWHASEPTEVLRPEHEWEGAGLPVAASTPGGVEQPVHQLRDPAIFEEEGRVYLLYTVAGAQGIAIAELTLD